MFSALLLATALLSQAPASAAQPKPQEQLVSGEPAARGVAAGKLPELVPLQPGAQKVLGFPGLKRVAVGNDLAVEVKLLGADQVLVIGLDEGNSSLMLFDETGGRKEFRIEVRAWHGEHDVVHALLEPLLETSPRFKVRQVGDRLYLDGEIATVEDYDRVRAVLESYPRLVFLARLDPRALEAKATQINRELARAGLPGAKATAVGQSLLLEGEVADELERRKAEAIATALFRPLKVIPLEAPAR